MTDWQDSPQTPKSTFVMIGLIVAGFMLAACFFAIALVRDAGEAPTPIATAKVMAKEPARPVAQPVATPVAGPVAGAKADPWPECAAVRRWFAENLPEPKTLQVIAWESRTRWGDRSDPMVLRVKFRAKNRHGGYSVVIFQFFCKDGRCDGHVIYDKDVGQF